MGILLAPTILAMGFNPQAFGRRGVDGLRAGHDVGDCHVGADPRVGQMSVIAV
jgi:hypothetical protein